MYNLEPNPDNKQWSLKKYNEEIHKIAGHIADVRIWRAENPPTIDNADDYNDSTIELDILDEEHSILIEEMEINYPGKTKVIL